MLIQVNAHYTRPPMLFSLVGADPLIRQRAIELSGFHLLIFRQERRR